MRRFERLLAASMLAVVAACSTTADQTPTIPEANPNGPQFGPPAVSNPYCSLTSSDAINTELHNLFVKNAWPDENSSAGSIPSRIWQAILGSCHINGRCRT